MSRLDKIAARLVASISESELLALLKQFEERERKYGRDPGVMTLEERPFSRKNYPGIPSSVVPDGAAIDIRALTSDGIALYFGLGKTKQDAMDDLAKNLKKGLWR
ncbi:MAG: hypothetical protein ACREHV_05895 [Rhizomicrobium sp.]